MPDDDHQRDLDAFEKNIREAVQERERQRRRQPQREPEPEKPRQQFRDNPLELPERHRADNAGNQEQRLRTIADQKRRDVTRENVEKYYSAWTQALKKAYAMRYDLSPRLYEKRLADRKIDERLIPDAEKDKMRGEAIRDAVTSSQMRMEDINHTLPKMIDKTIDDAARYTHDRDIADAIRNRTMQRGKDQDHDRER
ncbi:MAG: hypothetical protein ACRD8O_14930 [Bryobacteraceae bacterium]